MGTSEPGRLFHAIVLMGAALTGGAVTTACGGTTGTGSGGDAATDAPDDAYAHIAFNGDAYSNISIDAQPYPIDSPRDSGMTDSPEDVLPDCYPCIAPNQDI